MPRPGGPAYGSRVLEMGTDGLDTWELQLKLIGWGSGTDNDGIGLFMDPVRVHGTFDTTTRDAVKRFQKAHGLSVTGSVDGNTFRMIDRELRDHPVRVGDFKCPCAAGKNDGPILCHCPNHANAGKCTGFGKQRFAGQFLLDGSKTAGLPAEKLAVYDMEEYDGIDKAVIWAARALMHRAKLGSIKVVAGYRCWHDNYHHTDDLRWRHRRETLHLGKTIELIHVGKCVEKGKKPCPECERMRGVALAKCGYQLRWHELDRVVVGEGELDSAPPATPFALHLDTVLLQNREKADFVKTDADAAKPLYTGKVGLSLPMDLGDGRDPKVANTLDFYDNTEQSKGGQFPVGTGRIWHTGVHLVPRKSKAVYAMTDGEVVACRVGEKETEKGFGSRNFVLLKHTWKSKPLYSLSLHLDGEEASAKSKTGWRKQLYLKSVDHVEAIEDSPIYVLDKGKLVAGPGLDPGERAATTGGEIDPVPLDKNAPAGSKVIKLVKPKNAYVYTNVAGKVVAKANAADAALADKIKKHEVIGLEKTILVHAGDVIGQVAKAPTDPGLSKLGSYLHLEVFSESNLLTDPGFVLLDASPAGKVADRKEITDMLVAAKLMVKPPDGVLLDDEINAIGADPNRGRFRSAVLKMESAWSFDYKSAFKSAKMMGFMPDADRDALGDAFKDYAFWSDAKAGAKGSMPGSPTVFHYHPIVLLLAMAFAP
ncbi:MAG: peptidoglycan-binding domain-containing protein [Byssovorax sp.]